MDYFSSSWTGCVVICFPETDLNTWYNMVVCLYLTLRGYRRNVTITNLNIILSMPPISLTIQVPQLQILHQSEVYFGDSARDLAGDEVLPSPRTLVVEEKTVAREHAVCLPVVHHDPVAVEFCTRWKWKIDFVNKG